MIAIGLMSGTSMDGIDACLLETDGVRIMETDAGVFRPYDHGIRDRLRAAIEGRSTQNELSTLARDLTLDHVTLVADLLSASGRRPAEIDVIGFHGHTISHAPVRGQPGKGNTCQIGDGALLASETGIDTVCDFRSNDVAAGGEGAPLAPAYHIALAADLSKPLCILNVGGVANITWLGANGTVLAFDTGPGNALVDDLVVARTGNACDQDGQLAAAGRCDAQLIATVLGDEFFARTPPKSLDRNHFSNALKTAKSMALEDGAATLTGLTAACVSRAEKLLPARPLLWAVCGGGRKNPTMMAMLRDRLDAPVEPVEQFGWDGDFIEAQAFAYLAVRSLNGKPISYPGTTGVPRPLSGGTFYPSSLESR
jgi:anhydro-N-acetylmuramic acid kinase